MKNIFITAILALSTSAFAAQEKKETFTITTEEVTSDFSVLNKSNSSFTTSGTLGGTPTPPVPTPAPTFNDRVDQGGKVIQAARDLVALGEAIYELVKKGKPSNTTEYAPISVVPRDPISKEYIDPFDLENFSMPVEKSFVTKIKSSNGTDAVVFNYKIIYAYGGSWNGQGKYLTSVMVVPSSVRTSYGWDFNATMKLGGILNNGTKANPIAGIIINLKYQMNSWTAAIERTDSIYINGQGDLKNMNIGR